MVVALLVSALVVLGVALAVRRGVVRPPTERPSHPRAGAIALGALVVALAELPLLRALPSLLSAAVLSGDARSHMVVAASIARRGIARGWVDAYQGGFPLGPHYPSVGWLLDAALIRLGVDPARATHALGLFALLAVPAVAYAVAIRAGAGVPAAAAGGIVLAWLSPDSGFVGGTDAYLSIGVLSQVCAMPFAMALAASVVTGRGYAAPAWLAAATMLAHPQIGLATMAVTAVGCFALGSRAAWARGGVAAIAAASVGAAVYGPGIATLGVPFAWPPAAEWLIVGFRPSRLAWWLVDADLLDKGRAPLLTSVCAIALVVLGAQPRRPGPRTVVVVAGAALALAVSGVFLSRLGAIGVAARTFVQPLRMVATLPSVAAALVVVLTVEVMAWAPALGAAIGASPHRSRAAALAALIATALGIGMVALPQNARALRQRAALDGPGCGERTPVGFDADELTARLRGLEHGRLYYADTELLGDCADRHRLDLASAVRLASTPSVGGHVGVHYVAFHELHPERPGSAARAESLGVRYVLHLRDDGPREADEWRELYRRGDVTLSERLGGTDAVGVGCVTSVWRGSEPELVSATIAALFEKPSTLDRPHELIALERSSGALRKEDRDAGGCDVEGATVAETGREPGAFSADVTTAAPVDVVVRAASFPTWRVTVDGQEVAWQRVIPGFLAFRVAPGRHTVVAETRPSRSYLVGIFLALALTALLPPLLTRLRDRRRAQGGRAPFVR